MICSPEVSEKVISMIIVHFKLIPFSLMEYFDSAMFKNNI